MTDKDLGEGGLVFKNESLSGQAVSKFGLSQCPGKNMAKARDGKSYNRDITRDVHQYSEQGVTMIVCLLSDVEVRSIGANVNQYQAACNK